MSRQDTDRLLSISYNHLSVDRWVRFNFFAVASRLVEMPFRLFAAGYLSLLAVTWRLWLPQAVFPQVPLISAAGQVPRSVDFGLLAILVSSLSVLLFAQRTLVCRFASLMAGISTFALVCIDQHRLQPWTWQFIILSVVLATADSSVACATWRWLVIGIYFWSAWSKIDRSFCVEHGPFLIDGLCKSIGWDQGTTRWSDTLRYGCAAAIPLFELVVAVGLIWSRTRRIALIGSISMHVALIMALGPFGHGHQPGVLVWNVFFLVQNLLLFQKELSAEKRPALTAAYGLRHFGNVAASSIVAAAMIWPALETFGFYDHWPAWAVYAARPERTTIYIHSDELEKLPDHLHGFLKPQAILDDWQSFRIDRWSLEALAVPIYPQDRFCVGVALGLANDLNLATIRIVVQGPADRWTGNRESAEYLGLDSVNVLANSFRCGAQPRRSRFITRK